MIKREEKAETDSRGRRGKEVPLGQFPLKLVNQIQLFIFNTINSVSFLFRRHIITGRGEEREEDFFLPPNCSQFKDKAVPSSSPEYESLA